MPALPNVPGVIRADFGWSIGSDLGALTRLHIAYSGTPPTTTSAATLANTLFTDWAAAFLVYANTSVTLTSVRVTDLASTTGGQGEHLGSTVGTRAGDKLGAAVSLLASMHIGRRYRGGKPRSYLPLGVAEDLLTEQTWTLTFLSNVQASLDSFRTNVATITAGGCSLGSLVNVSYYHGFVVETNPITGRARNVPVLRTGGPVVDNAVNWVAEQRLSSQRRRNLRQS